MKAEVLDKVIQAASITAEVGAGVGHMKEAVAEFIDDGLKSAKRAARHGRRAAEDLVDDARYQFKQRPVGTAAICFAIGLGLGTVMTILLAPKGRHS
jgi:hypothetical protein